MRTPDQRDLFTTDRAATPKAALEPDNQTPSIPCPKCNGRAWLTLASVLYSEIDRKYIYWCKLCDTRVGCHNDTAEPLGTAADAELRRARSLLHRQLDPIWRAELQRERKKNPSYKESKARRKFYERLATAMKLTAEDCHIAKFDLEQCRKATKLLEDGALQRGAGVRDAGERSSRKASERSEE